MVGRLDGCWPQWLIGLMANRSNSERLMGTDGQTDRQTDRQTDGWTNKQTDICDSRVAFATEKKLYIIAEHFIS